MSNKPTATYELTSKDIEGYDWSEIMLECQGMALEDEAVEIEGYGIYTSDQIDRELEGMGY